jgi:hypothetical protein
MSYVVCLAVSCLCIHVSLAGFGSGGDRTGSSWCRSTDLCRIHPRRCSICGDGASEAHLFDTFKGSSKRGVTEYSVVRSKALRLNQCRRSRNALGFAGWVQPCYSKVTARHDCLERCRSLVWSLAFSNAS